MADKLAAAKVPVLTGAMNNIPGSFSTLGSRQENAAMLRKAGVKWRSSATQAAATRSCSTFATCATKPATPSRTVCRGTTRCAP